VIAPLLSRDMLISKRQQYALNLTYKFTTDANGSVTFTASKLHNVLYESCFDAQFLIISDGNKRAVGKSDTFPENINLDKGTYSIRLQVCIVWRRMNGLSWVYVIDLTSNRRVTILWMHWSL
jgi:Tripeptidyl peptidase II